MQRDDITFKVVHRFLQPQNLALYAAYANKL